MEGAHVSGHHDLPVPGTTILVADDDPRDRSILRDGLELEGYRVREARDGEEALTLAMEHSVDVILLNVVMPRLDGIEVCRRLAAHPETAPIPVILVTSQRRREVRLDGIAAGARDFLLKPVDLADLRVRVRNASQMKRMYDESQERFRRISALEALRDSLVHMIVHDMRTPLTGVVTNLQLLEMVLSEEPDPEAMEILRTCLNGAEILRRMVDSLLDVSKMESGTMELSPVLTPLFDLAEAARESLGSSAVHVVLSESPEPGATTVHCDRDILQRVLMNLLVNALDYSPSGVPVILRIEATATGARVSVEDRGQGVPEEFRETIFEKFGQVSGTRRLRKASVGLGLAFARLAVEAHGGKISVHSHPEGGSIFSFTVPRYPPQSAEIAQPS